MNKLILVALAAMLSTGAVRPPAAQTWTGWFSDQQCAREPKADEAIRPNGTGCVKECLLKGSPAVFLSEQTNFAWR